MERLCERPGCSDPASVSYGMRAADMVFWLDALRDGDEPSPGVLCRRHADSMVVPRNWTLDDMRDPDLHLFRPPAADPPTRTPRRRAAHHPTNVQLELGVDPAASASADGEPAEAATARGHDTAASEDEPPPEPWTPAFDGDDDLGGLLAARSPLLARAFRGADRPRSR